MHFSILDEVSVPPFPEPSTCDWFDERRRYQ
jgi:hypothetical protein